MKDKKNILKITSIEDYKELVNYISNIDKDNIYVFLYGDLGAGKTTFSKFLIEFLIEDCNVSSPTFNILQIYENEKFKIMHYDLYRIKNSEELYEIFSFDHFGKMDKKYISLIEWPNIGEDFLKNENIIKIYFTTEKNDNRILAIEEYLK